MKKVAILQSNYIPWKGYFDMIDSVDEFVFYDIVQYTKNDWRNRNKIKVPTGLKWLSIPVHQKGAITKAINEVTVTDNNWVKSHPATIKQFYKAAPHFEEVFPIIKNIYKECNDFEYLSEINIHFIKSINNLLEINTNLHFAENFSIPKDRNERLIEMCKQLSATNYLSGPAAQSYVDVNLFNQNGIEVEWMDYSGYKEYPQLFPPFEHGVSIVDLLLNVGVSRAKEYLKK